MALRATGHPNPSDPPRGSGVGGRGNQRSLPAETLKGATAGDAGGTRPAHCQAPHRCPCPKRSSEPGNSSVLSHLTGKLPFGQGLVGGHVGLDHADNLPHLQPHGRQKIGV